VPYRSNTTRDDFLGRCQMMVMEEFSIEEGSSS